MLDQQDLQAIADLIAASEQRLIGRMDSAIAASEQRLIGRMDSAIAASEQRTDAKLAAMEQRTDAKLAAMEQRLTGRIDESIAASEQRIKTEVTHDTMVMMEQYFQPKFDLLAENQQLILEKLDGKVDKEDCQNSMSVVAAAIRAHSRDIDELKA